MIDFYRNIEVLPSHKQMLFIFQPRTSFGRYRPSSGDIEEYVTDIGLHRLNASVEFVAYPRLRGIRLTYIRTLTFNSGRAIAQAVSRWLPTAAVRV
jgi:hypothetical protein